MQAMLEMHGTSIHKSISLIDNGKDYPLYFNYFLDTLGVHRWVKRVHGVVLAALPGILPANSWNLTRPYILRSRGLVDV